MAARILIGALTAVVLAGCGGSGALVPGSTGAVTGHVMSRVCGGAYRMEETPCPMQPMPGARLVFRLNGGTATATATTDASGAYHVQLQPGTYSVDVNGQGPHGRLSGPRQVAVSAGQTVIADFTFSIQLL